MSTDNKFDPQSAAVVIMDFQEDIVETVARNPARVVDRARRVLTSARANRIPVIYVVHHGGRFAEAGQVRRNDVELVCERVEHGREVSRRILAEAMHEHERGQ